MLRGAFKTHRRVLIKKTKFWSAFILAEKEVGVTRAELREQLSGQRRREFRCERGIAAQRAQCCESIVLFRKTASSTVFNL